MSRTPERGWERPRIETGTAGGCLEFQRVWNPSRTTTRRSVLKVGALTAGGLTLGLPDLVRLRCNARADVTDGRTPRAKSCILIFMWGGPSHLDTWDPKPDAPAEVRGEFKPIATRTPGLWISEHFPQLAERTDRLAVIRSMSHDDPAHLSPAHRVFTGHLAPVVKSDRDGPSARDWPCVGAMLGKLLPPRDALPASVTMPWIVSHPAAPGGRAPGQNGGWLGRAYDPLYVVGDPNAEGFRVPGLEPPAEVGPERLTRRKSLLEQLDGSGGEGAVAAWDRYQDSALQALTSTKVQEAFRIDREHPKTRERYGRHIHGQCLLLARRLVEAGVPLVTVNWHDDRSNFWDTHGDNFNQLKTRLMPPADQGFAALLDDLEARGMLEETLVVWTAEFGRHPRITAANAGREHWPWCYSSVLAGAGVRGGVVHGASDRLGAYPTTDPVTPEDIVATIYERLGIDPNMEVRDPLNRPLPLTRGTPLRAILS